MKKWIALLLVLTMALSLMTACGKEDKNETEPQSTTNVGTVTEASDGDLEDYTFDTLPASNGDVVEDADAYPASDGDVAA